MWNREKRIQGHSDAELSELGVLQAERLALRLRGQRFDSVHASDLQRALHTARIVFPEAEILTDTRLRERSSGLFEGKTRAEFSAAEHTAYLAYQRDPLNCSLPQGESWQELSVRVQGWLQELPETGRIAAFSHGGAIRAALFSVMGVSRPCGWDFKLDNTGVTRLHLGERVLLETVNDTAHLEGALDD
jgi:broad specificity phosphatase PhoE